MKETDDVNIMNRKRLINDDGIIRKRFIELNVIDIDVIAN